MVIVMGMSMKKTVFILQGPYLIADGVSEMGMSSMKSTTKMKMKMEMDTGTTTPHATASKQHFAPVTTRKNYSSNAGSRLTLNSHDVFNQFHPSTRTITIPTSSDRNALLDVAHEREGCDVGRTAVRMLRLGMRIMFLIGWLVVVMMMMRREGEEVVWGVWKMGNWKVEVVCLVVVDQEQGDEGGELFGRTIGTRKVM